MLEHLSRTQMCIRDSYKEHASEMANLGENAKEKMRWNSVDSICLAIENEYAKKYPELICEVSPYYTGNAFYVNVYKQYDDIRLVFAQMCIRDRLNTAYAANDQNLSERKRM